MARAERAQGVAGPRRFTHNARSIASCKPKLKTTVIPEQVVTHGLTVTLTLSEVQALFNIVGNIGGGYDERNNRPTDERKLCNDLYEVISDKFNLYSTGPFVETAGSQTSSVPYLRRHKAVK